VNLITRCLRGPHGNPTVVMEPSDTFQPPWVDGAELGVSPQSELVGDWREMKAENYEQ
jgi:hypothetical protein